MVKKVITIEFGSKRGSISLAILVLLEERPNHALRYGILIDYIPARPATTINFYIFFSVKHITFK
jgi:hypothetical protein